MLKRLSLTPEYDEVVNGHGRIVRRDNYWRLSWTTQREGYLEIDRYVDYPLAEDALPLIQNILAGDTL